MDSSNALTERARLYGDVYYGYGACGATVDGYAGGGLKLIVEGLLGIDDHAGITITNTVNDAADMINSATPILFKQYYYDAGTPAPINAGQIVVSPEGNWTSAAGTQDSYMSFWTTLNGTMTEYLKITSAGRVTVNNQISFDAEVAVGTLAAGGTTNIDWATGNCQFGTMGAGNTTLTFTASSAGVGTYILRILHDQTPASRTLTFPSSYHIGETGKSAHVYTLASGATMITVFTIYCDGTDYYVAESKFHA